MTYPWGAAYDPAVLDSLAGREREVAELERLLERVSGSTAGAALIEGPAGIGKSSLIGSVVQDAQDRGFAVAGTRCDEYELQRAFGAGGRLLAAMTSGGSDAEIADLLAGEKAGTAAGFLLADRLVEAAEAIALRQPLLVWLDDAQWADDWTLRATGVVLRRLDRLPVAVVVGARPSPRSDELAKLVAGLAPHGPAVRLRPLSDDDVAALVGLRFGVPPGPRLAAALGGAGGNPFFVTELLDALSRDELLMPSDEEVEVDAAGTPPGLLVTVLHRMRRLPEPDLELIRMAAILGGSFTVAELAIATGRRPDELLEPLLRLRDEGIFSEEKDRFRFRHDLMREAVYEDLGGPVRAAIHASVGHAFAEAGFDPVEASHHLLLGAQPGDAAAVDLMITASGSGRLTLPEATALLRRVLELAPSHPDGAQLKRRLGTLLRQVNRPAEAIALLEEVLAEAPDPASQLDTVDALSVAAGAMGDDDAFRRWRDRAAELAADLSDSTEPFTLLHVSKCHHYRGDLAAARAVAQRAIPLATAAGDAAAEEGAESACSWLSTLLGRPLDALAHCRRALELSRGSPTEGRRRFHHASARADLWEYDTSRAELAKSRNLLEEAGELAWLLMATCRAAWLEWAAGQLEEATVYADTGLELMQEVGITTDVEHPAVVRGWVALLAGQPDQAAAWLDRFPIAKGFRGTWLRFRIEWAVHGAKAAMQWAPFLLRTTEAQGAIGPEHLPDLVRAARAAGDEGVVEEALRVSVEAAAGTQSPSVELSALRCRAFVQQDAEAAVKAISLASECPWPLERGGAFEDAAEALPDRRTELLDAARATYESAGFVSELARLGSAAGMVPIVRERAATGWEALTDAELRVVELAAEGLTNREIGARLFVSHRTVGAHLAHIFDKLQIRSRVELAREATARKPAHKA